MNRDGVIPLTQALLLMDASAALRYRVLTELLGRPASERSTALLKSERESEIDDLLQHDGLRGTRDIAWRLCQLAHIGVDRRRARVRKLADALFARQRRDGSFPLADYMSGDRYDSIPLQTAIPLRALAAVGYAQDPRAERAYEWLLGQRIADGSWPTGYAAGQLGYRADYRRLAGSTGCRANTVGALACLVLHPKRAESTATRVALQLVLLSGPGDRTQFGSEIARLVGVERPRGFITFYSRSDAAFILSLAARAAFDSANESLRSLVAFVVGLRDSYGLWTHERHPEVTRWLTFDILWSLQRLGLSEQSPGSAGPRETPRGSVF